MELASYLLDFALVFYELHTHTINDSIAYLWIQAPLS